jgi:hypothetical protein
MVTDVYVVTGSEDYEGSTILDIFASESAAQNYAAEWLSQSQNPAYSAVFV